MREALTKVLVGCGNLDENDYAERPVDRVHAIAAVQRKAIEEARGKALLVPLGRLLMPIIDSGGREDRWIGEAINGLAACLLWKEHRLRLREDTARFIAKQAIHEAANAKCGTCKGIMDSESNCSIPDIERMAGKSVWDGPVPLKLCPACNGTGKKRWGDDEREKYVGEAVRFQAAFSMAHSLISRAIDEALTPYRPFLRG